MGMSAASGETIRPVRWILRAEGLCVFGATLLAYSRLGLDWRLFALFFLVPDLSFLGYLAGPRIGALTYNAAHAYIGGIICVAAGFLLPATAILGAGVIWCSHVGFDRALGYGLKYPAGFGFTHLGVIAGTGRSNRNPAAGPTPRQGRDRSKLQTRE